MTKKDFSTGELVMTEPYNLKPAFDDLQERLKMKSEDLASFLYDCKNWRITEDNSFTNGKMAYSAKDVEGCCRPLYCYL